MIHTEHYRTSLPHQLHPNQSHLQPAFPGRFPGSNLESLNAVMLPALGPQDHVQYPPMTAFVNSNVRLNDQLNKVSNDQRKTDRQFSNEERERRDNCQDNFKTQSPETQQQQQFTQQNQQTQQQSQPQCFKPASRKIDAATMTDPEEEEQNTNWQNVSVPTNTKVAEYLSSLRQFLKLNNPDDTTTTTPTTTNKKVKKKRQLGDVRIMTAADGTRLFCCPECHVAYPDKSLLEPHLAGHKIERRWLCGVCGAGLKRKEHLDRHQLCHSEERPFACTACPKAFKRNEHLTRHYIIHTGEKQQGRSSKKSTSSSSVFTFSLGRTKYSIQDQKYSLHDAKYSSSLQVQDQKMLEKSLLPPPAAPPPVNLDCSVTHTSTVSSSYSLHIPPLPSATSVPQGNNSKYMYGVCGVTDARREHMERLKMLHSGEQRPFSCTICGKAFKRNEHLVRHAETHSGQRSHACGECGKAFYRKDHLAKHVALHMDKKTSNRDATNLTPWYPLPT